MLGQKKELEEKLREKYVHRDVPSVISTSELIRVIIGPRRAGKSFFGMHQLVADHSFGFVNFDDERLVKVKNFDEILETAFSVYQNPTFLLLDEIQNLPDWELIVNRLQRKGLHLIITGSNANLLSSELSTHLTGRHLPVNIFTFSFGEYLSSFQNELTENEIKERFNDFLINGGYPEPLMKSLNYREYLNVLFDSILFKDIVKRYRIRHAILLENLAVWLISNITTEFSLQSLSKQTQISSVHTVKKYLGYLEESFIFFTVSLFSFKIGEQQRANKKIYCYDNGFYMAKAFHFSEDRGKLLENVIASELRKRCLYNGANLFYWKSNAKEEVDFVVQQGIKVTQLIQVCWDTSNIKTREREVRALLKASKKLNCTQLMVISYDEEAREKFNWFGLSGEVEFIPARKWLLSA